MSRCAICLQNCDGDLNRYECFHIFHKSCIKKWYGDCPTCMAQKKSPNLEEVEYWNRGKNGCWYCGSQTCYLTHKYDNPINAVKPDNSPYNFTLNQA